jgi:3-oxoacyl-[acyl-carrier protein] reductase
MEIDGSRIIVTGAASGLGYCFAMQLAKCGAIVMAADIDRKGLDLLRSDSEGLPGRVLVAPVDVAQEDSVVEFVANAFDKLGSVDALVNNAGITRDGWLVRRENDWVRKMPTVQWQQVLDVNLTGPFLMAREVLARWMRLSARERLIVNISSVTSAGNPGQSSYSAAKAGLDADTRTWALEFASFGVRVAGIAPGLIETPMLRHLSDDAKEHVLAKIPLGRLGRPYDIWHALRFVFECEYFTGRTIPVDGGIFF